MHHLRCNLSLRPVSKSLLRNARQGFRTRQNTFSNNVLPLNPLATDFVHLSVPHTTGRGSEHDWLIPLPHGSACREEKRAHRRGHHPRGAHQEDHHAATRVCLSACLAGWLAEGLFTLGACSHQRNPIGLNRIELAGRGMIIHDFS
jgi:hypothetical protein